MAVVHYPVLLPEQTAYMRYAGGALPISDSIATEVVSLPRHCGLLARSQDDEIAAAVTQVLRG